MRSPRVAWSLFGACVTLAAAALVFLALNGSTTHSKSIGEPAVDALFGLVYLSFPVIGLLIALRRPGNSIGWLFLVGGLAAQAEDALLGYATYALIKEPGSLPAGEVAGVVADTLWIPSLAAGLTLLLLLFPTGRPPSPRWNVLVWIVAADVAVYVVSTLLNPGPLYFFESRRNPLGIEGLGSVLGEVVDLAGPPILLTVLAAAVSLFLRFRRSRGVERQQLKWLVYSAGVIVALTPLMIALGSNEVELAGVLASDLIFALLVALVPLAVGAAVLRHRLYEIDVVINRTLVYGALTATLAATYLGTVLLLQLALEPLTKDSGLAIAGSTLAVAALFRPARSRIQSTVDRRFYRRRYDAARTLEGFGVRVRNQVELDSVGAELRDVVVDTMQPAHVSLWLREARG